MPSKCCRSCPRCNDCPVLLAAAARARDGAPQSSDPIATLVGDVLSGVAFTGRALPDSVTRTLDALDAARRGTPLATA